MSQANGDSKTKLFLGRIVSGIILISAIAGIAGTVVTHQALEEERAARVTQDAQQAIADQRQMAQATQQWEAQATTNAVLIESFDLQSQIATKQTTGIDATEAAILQSTREALQELLDEALTTLTPGARSTQVLPDVSPSTSTPTPTHTPTIVSTPTNTITPLPSATLLPSLTPTPISIPQFRDTFDNGFQPDWVFNEEYWAVVNGQLTNLSGSRFTNTSGLEDAMQLGDATWANYSVQLDFIRGPGSRFESCQLGFLITEENNRINYLTLLMLQNDVHLQRNGTTIPDGSIRDLEVPYSVRINASGDQVTVYIDETQVLQSNVLGYNNGFVAIACTGFGGLIDNFVVTPLNNTN